MKTIPHARRARPLIWTGAGALLFTPLVAMQFTDQVAWAPRDFLVFGAMLLAVIGGFELLVRHATSPAGRAGACIAVAAAFLLVWANLAVGIIGDEGNPANLMFAGALAIAIAGAAIARFKPAGLARALAAAAAAQLCAAAVALSGAVGPVAPRELLAATAFFTALWLTSACLFGRAARQAKQQ